MNHPEHDRVAAQRDAWKADAEHLHAVVEVILDLNERTEPKAITGYLLAEAWRAHNAHDDLVVNRGRA